MSDTSALSPLDGRYAKQVEPFARAFSEAALFRQRFRVEVAWFLALANEPAITELGPIPDSLISSLQRWVDEFGAADVSRIKQIESVINHDVKAVEYLLKEKLTAAGLGPETEFVHFACTSEDINNLAYALMLREGLEEGWLPRAEGLTQDVWAQADEHAALSMPSHTHGQTATPTTLGKELAVFVSRWSRITSQIRQTKLLAKFNGAVGTYSAHVAAAPEVDWIRLSERFVESFGFEWNPLTTQIEAHDTLAEVLHSVVRFNAVLIDFCRDMWEYISRGYLRQRTVAGEVGSSTMPHKVNPIDFENAEANAGVSSALLEHLASKLMVSRMQRDLSDSSAIRNVGPGLAHSGLALLAARRGVQRITPAPEVMARELEGQWEVLAEAIQTVMRRYGLPEPYERLKELTRGSTLSREDVRAFVASLELPPEAEARLLSLTPEAYIGLAAELVKFGRTGEGR